MATSRIVVHAEGPLFDGEAQAAVTEWLDSAKQEIADIGATWIKIEAHGFNRSGRGGTGQAAQAVTVSRYGPLNDVRIRGGMAAGQVWWPWLEGISPRNASTGFKGYKTFRKTRLRLRRIATPFAQQRLEEFIARLGGGAL